MSSTDAFSCPTREDFEKEVQFIEYICSERKEKSLIPILIPKFITGKDKNDKTNVFDFIDDEWFDRMYGIVERVFGNDWYAGDGSLEHRIADVMVTVNIGHKLPNGNKRSSVLVAIVVYLYRGLFFVPLSDNNLYTITKKVAEDGNSKKEESVKMVRDFLKKQKFIEI